MGLSNSDAVSVAVVFTGLPMDRDEVEEALEAVSGPDSEIIGAGSGMGRCHLHLEIEASMASGPALDRLHAVLAELAIEAYATVNVSD